MSQILLVGSYIGCSDFVYEVECTGRKVLLKEVMEKNLVSMKQLKQNKIDYFIQWFEVKPGDEVRIRMETEGFKKQFVYKIIGELPNIPQTLEQFLFDKQHDYLAQHCESV